MDANRITETIIGAAMKVHTELGPGLLEKTYEVCLAHEVEKRGLSVETQLALPIVYDSLKLEAGYRIDMLVAESVIVEVKSVEALAPVHQAQLLTYLKLSGKRIGLLINFNVLHLRDGIKRMING